jgi:hypothetical protein
MWSEWRAAAFPQLVISGRAERLLTNLLWDEGKPPLGGRLTLTEIDRDELMGAERWSDD